MASKNPTVRAIEIEAKRRSLADDGKTSPAERYAIRAELRQQAGLGKEQKQRGGIAGAYDRNKKFVLPVAALAAGLIPGLNAAVPAILGGLQGFDRPGEGGIGYDLGSGIKGAVSGYGLGKVGGALGNLAGIGGGTAAAGAVPGAVPASTSAVPAAVPAGAAPAASAASGGGILDTITNAAGKAKDWLTADGGRNALGAISAIDAASQRRRADDLAAQAVGLDTGRWRDSAPLRAAGMDRLLNPVPVDTSRLAALGAQGNPFASNPAIPSAPTPAPAAPAAIPVGPPPVALTPKPAKVPKLIARAAQRMR